MSRANLPKCNFLNHDISTSILIILSSQKKQKNTLANKYFINYQIIIRKEYYKIQSDCQSLITSSSRRIIIIKLNEWNYNRSSSQRCIGRLKRHRISIPTFPKKELLLLRTQYNVKQRVNNSPCNQSYPNQTEVNRTLLPSPIHADNASPPPPRNFPFRVEPNSRIPNFNRRISQRVSSKDERAPASSRSWSSRIDPGNKRRRMHTPNRAELEFVRGACKSLPSSPPFPVY